MPMVRTKSAPVPRGTMPRHQAGADGAVVDKQAVHDLVDRAVAAHDDHALVAGGALPGQVGGVVGAFCEDGVEGRDSGAQPAPRTQASGARWSRWPSAG